MAIPDFNFDQDERADNVTLGETIVPEPQLGERETLITPYMEPAPSVETTPESAQQAPVFSESDYLSGLFEPRPRPVEDKERKKRLETMATAKGIGKSLSVLGDAFSLAKGGIVPKSRIQPDEPAVAQIMEDSRRFREKMEAADFQDYMTRLKTGQAIGAAKGREQKAALETERYQAETELEAERYREGRDLAAQLRSEGKIEEAEKAEESARRFGIEQKFAGRKQTEVERKNRVNELAAIAKANKAVTTAGKTYPLYDKTGKKIADVDDGQVDKMFDIIKNNVDIGEDLALLKAQVGGAGLTKEHKRTIVASYSDMPELSEFLHITESPVGTTVTTGENIRADGTEKGTGYFGVLKTKDGRDATEMSIGVEMNGKETEIPTLVPTLSEEEKQYLLNTPIENHFTADKKMFNQIRRKAEAHARKRIEEGKSPFAETETETKTFTFPGLGGAMKK